MLDKWAKLGFVNWRLDVADELPDAFIEMLRVEVKKHDPSGVLLGEVWDDASNKMWAKGLRRYVYGSELDSVMNYPFRDAVLDFFTGMIDADALNDALGGQRERYPEPFYRACMNTLGSHDTQRVLSVLSGAPKKDTLTREQQSRYLYDEAAVALGKKRLRAAAYLQYSMPQVPCVFYGDEAGMLGLTDPFNRGTYPWGNEDLNRVDLYRSLGKARREHPALVSGKTAFLAIGYDCFAVYRREGRETVLTLVNRAQEPREIRIAAGDFTEGPDADDVRFALIYRDILACGEYVSDCRLGLELTLPACGAMMLVGMLPDQAE